MQEWKRDVSNYPPAKEIAARVAEGLRQLGTFAAPVIEQFRLTLNAALESLFERKSPETITSADIIRELDTFTSPADETPAPEDDPEAAAASDQALQQITTTTQTNEGMESLLGKLAAGQFRAPAEGEDGRDIRIHSSLTDDFVYLDGYQTTQEVGARQRELEAHQASEVVWQDEADEADGEFQFQEELVQIQLMGFDDTPAIRGALTACNGSIEDAIAVLFV